MVDIHRWLYCRFTVLFTCTVAAGSAYLSPSRAGEQATSAPAAATAAHETVDLQTQFSLPEGFEITLFADDSLAHNIFSLTIDADGHVVVAGPNYVKRLHDDDGDGRADRATLFSERPASGAHGMYFDGNDLICTGDHGLWRLTDKDADGKADGRGEKLANLRHPEHGGNGVVRGPDGWYYVMCGNDAGVSAEHVRTPGSPVKTPRCGAVVRVDPRSHVSEVVAHGFRNPYDLAFNASGHLFTVEADGERDHHLPWYAPNRLFDIAAGMEHGWLIKGWQRSWNRPESFYDNVDRLSELGRGSPTGVLAYRHRQFPPRYRQGVFSVCWTFGRVFFHHLSRHAASYRAESETFMETTGNVGFAPVDLAVGPTGDMYVAIGGRQTRGSVFRIRYADAVPTKPTGATRIDQVLSADQPHSSWSRVRWLPLARQCGADALLAAAGDRSRPIEQRVRAVEVLVEVFGRSPLELAQDSHVNVPAELLARIAWACGRAASSAATSVRMQMAHELSRLTGHDDAWVRRAAWEAIASWPTAFTGPRPAWDKALGSVERRIRWAAILAARGPAAASYRDFQQTVRLAPGRLALADLWIHSPDVGELPESVGSFVDLCLQSYESASPPGPDGDSLQLEVVRLLQIGLGDVRTSEGMAEVYSGYVGNVVSDVPSEVRRRIVATLAPQFPTQDGELNRELGRLLCMLAGQADDLPARVAEFWTDKSSVSDDVHYLIVASRLPGNRDAATTDQTAKMLANLHVKLAVQGKFPSRNWPQRVGEAFDELRRHDGGLSEALVAQPAFGHSAHVMFARRFDGSLRAVAIRKMFRRATGTRSEEDNSIWTSELVGLVAELPRDETLPILRELWDGAAPVQNAVARVLARNGAAVDRDRLVAALRLTEPPTVAEVARALAGFETQATPTELACAVRSLRRFCQVPNARATRQSLAKLLTTWTAEQFDVDDVDDETALTAYQPWFEFFRAQYPNELAFLDADVGTDLPAWKQRLAAIAWDRGNVQNGRKVFEARACHRCHSGARRLGPNLRGVAGRFSRDDLFFSIVDPNQAVSPTYQVTTIVTKSGRVYSGLPIYASPDGTLLQTGPDVTVRIRGAEVRERRAAGMSLMPTGMLEGLADDELADLYAYLKSL